MLLAIQLASCGTLSALRCFARCGVGLRALGV